MPRSSFLPPGRTRRFAAAIFSFLFVAAGLNAADAPRVDSAAARAYRDRAEKELRGDILPFWLAHARDRRHQGIYNEITNDLVVQKGKPRGSLLTARILWTFSAAYRRYHDPAYLEMAQWAYRDLVTHFIDEKNGGLYWSITFEGRPLDTRKVIYGEVFGIYALSEFYRATGGKDALAHAIAIYRLVEEHAHDRVNRGYYEEFTADWKPSTGRSALGATGAKSQNVHIHMLESYTSLLRVWPDPGLKENLGDLMEVLLTKILDPGTHHLTLFLTPDWKPQGDTISFGHDIEFSWLVVEAAEVLGDPAIIKRAEKNALAIAGITAANGVDADGGIYNEAEPGKGVTDSRKEWWPQAEATIGFLNAYQLSGDPVWFQRSLHTWDFIDRCIVDHRKGEWFRGVTKDEKPLSPFFNKVSFWKCPYHNGRACLELIDRLAPLASAP
jgi:mannobiose 2-epimerase